MFIKAALDEPHTDDILFNCNGLNIALHKSLGPGSVPISVDYSESSFTVSAETIAAKY
jgi:hypothetical protein